MELFVTLPDDLGFDIQADSHLERGDVDFVDGPDRAYLYLPYRCPGSGNTNGIDAGKELLAIWRVDSAAAELLATAIGAPIPIGSKIKPFELTWICAGKIAVKRQPIGADAAMWLIHALASENLLDYQAHLFGGHCVNLG
ncbi:MAG TPA: hypothetical protein VJ576_02645 [Rhodocyclaceae bacterium]|nr:hypothetical protein [Rhodocyclaceae bacterium]